MIRRRRLLPALALLAAIGARAESVGAQGIGGRESSPPETSLTIARLRYAPGDWYGNPTSLPNLLAFVRAELALPTADREAVAEGLGMPTRRIKLLMFTSTAVWAGMAGAFLVTYVGIATP